LTSINKKLIYHWLKKKKRDKKIINKKINIISK